MPEATESALCSIVVPIFDTSELREKVARLLPHSTHAPVPVSEAVVGAEDDAIREAFSDALAEIMEKACEEFPGIDFRLARITLDAEMDDNGSPCVRASVYAENADWQKFRGMR